MEWRLELIENAPGLITTLDLHTGGEPLRLIIDGWPRTPGTTILEKRAYAQRHLDHLRRALMWEPRGHRDMYGAVLTEPERPDSHHGILFMHNEGFSTMCGHGIIAVATALAQFAGAPLEIRFDTPAGLVVAGVDRADDGEVESVTFHNVPSFAAALDLVAEVPGIGQVPVDIGFGGAFYAVVEAAAAGFTLDHPVAEIVDLCHRIKSAMSNVHVHHPDHSDLEFIYGVIVTDQPVDPVNHSRNLCVFADDEADRSPTGTGVSARLAILAARGEMKVGDSIRVESILGPASVFGGQIVAMTKVAGRDAIIPAVTGSADVVGVNRFLVDPHDELGAGFLLR